ncbi:nuclear envelope integral membrane protein 2 isoform X1 [Malaclemys terrapin pileata]|uniref:nuclear envelope integral membrane protein 2 isoform X1 n=1 Tax=Malaclemys terrapin pileata TaxID=2991368 RepID=UPI0023A7C8DE|nr:nuclear envelope integral membrane protein 2 isoform X1 [Malaclemys terrapin pileata]
MQPAGSPLRLLFLLSLARASGAAAGADKNCSHLKEMDVIQKADADCYCYMQNGTMHLKYIWSALQVKINSTEMFKFVPITAESNCHNSETIFAFFKCIVQIIWQSEASKETVININQYGENVCFTVQPYKKVPYTVSVQRNMVDRKLILLFVAGVFLFHFANALSRSAMFYYCAGVALGVLATLVFILLTLKRFIPKHSTFGILMSGFWMSSLYFIYCLKGEMKWLWSEYRNYLLGYFLTVGFISFVVCYKHGPLTNERSITLLTWTLQLIAFVLIYFGVTIPQVAYAVIAIILCSKVLCYPLGMVCFVGRKIKNFFKSKKLVFRLLTEEEYREQGETETVKALDELRSFCRSPDFSSWLAVSKLQSPKKFANFILGSPHVSPAEVNAYDELYGIGGSFLEQQLFSIEPEPEQNRLANSIQEDDYEDDDEMQEQNESENVSYSNSIGLF